MASIREIRKAYEAGMKDGLREAGQECLSAASAIIAAEATDRGTLLSSGEVDDVKQRSVTVRWPVPQAKWVNYGTRPHWPPFAPILAWVKRNIRRYTMTSGERVDIIKPSGQMKERAGRTPDAVAQEVARAIQAKIAKEGTAPVHFAERAAGQVRPSVSGKVRDAIDERLARLK